MKFKDLEKRVGRELAEKEVIRQLRMVADELEGKNQKNFSSRPFVLDAVLPVELSTSLDGVFMCDLELTISHPLPG